MLYFHRLTMSTLRSEVHNVSRTRDDSQGRLIQRLFTFNCDDCGRTYGSSTKLSRHRRDKHGPQLNCYHCGKEFAQSRRWALEIHVKTCKAKFRYRAHDERGYEVNRGQHANRRQEYHPYNSVPQSSADSYRPVSQPSVNRTKPCATVTLATLNAPLSTNNEYDKSAVETVDLSTNTQSVRSPGIETFSFYDQNDVMNGFTNLSVPEAQFQLATCKTIHVPLSNTNDFSDLINFDLPLTLDNTSESKDSQEDRRPSDSKIEVSHPTPTAVSLANHNTGTAATTTCTSSMSQEIFQIPTIGGTQQQQQMRCPPPTTTVQQQQQMMAPTPTTTVQQQQQQMRFSPPTSTVQQQHQMMAPLPTTTVQQQQQQQMRFPPPTTTVQQQQQMMAPLPTTTVEQQQQMIAPPPTSTVQQQQQQQQQQTIAAPPSTTAIQQQQMMAATFTTTTARQQQKMVTPPLSSTVQQQKTAATTPNTMKQSQITTSPLSLNTVQLQMRASNQMTGKSTANTKSQFSNTTSFDTMPAAARPQKMTPPTVSIPRLNRRSYFPTRIMQVQKITPPRVSVHQPVMPCD